MKRATLFLALLAALVPPAAGASPLKIATTLSSYADIAKVVGGEYVETSFVASPKFNPHFIEPRPSDVLKVQRSDLFIHSGLDLEAWRGPLVDAAGRSDLRSGGAKQLDLSVGIPLLEVPSGQVSRAEGDIHAFGNPHYWLDPYNGIKIAESIAAKLGDIDPAHAAEFNANRDKFTADLRRRIDGWRRVFAALKGRELVGYHNEWVYLMKFLGVRMEQFLEPKPGIPPTPRQLQFLIGYISEHHVRGIVQSSYHPRDAAESVAQATGASVLLLAQGVGEVPEASSYAAMLDFDIARIKEALSHE